MGRCQQTMGSKAHRRRFHLTVLRSVLCGSTALLAVCGGAATAADCTWTGNADTNWDAPGNWTAGVPSAGDNAVIAPGDAVAFLDKSTPGSVGSFRFMTGADPHLVNIGAAFSIHNGITNQSANQQEFDVFSGSLSFTGGTIANTGGGSVFLNNGANMSFTGASSGDATITNTGTVDYNTGASAGSSAIDNQGTINFNNNSTGGTATVNKNGPVAGISFNDTSNAQNITITNNAGADTIFNNNANAGNATITNVRGSIQFNDTSSAGSATLTNDASSNLPRTIIFNGNSTAANATITSATLFGTVNFFDSSSAGSANITVSNSSTLAFQDTSSAGQATITANNLGVVNFRLGSTGGQARLIINAGGTVRIDALTGSGMTAGSIEGAGTLMLGAKQLTVGLNNLSTDFSGVIRGTGGVLTKTGSGKLTISGTGNLYTGATNINGGILAVDGSITTSSVVNVNSGGTLGGHGTVSKVIVAAGGTLAPGNSIGTINVSGNLTFNPGSNYQVEVSPTAADKTVVTGTAALAGTVNAIFQSGGYINKSYTILTAATRSGTFDSIATSNLPPGFAATLSYTGTSVMLDLAAVGIVAPGLNVNQSNVAGSLSAYFLNGGSLPPGFGTLFGLTGDQLRNGLSQVSGEAGAASAQGGMAATSQFINAIFDQLSHKDSGSGGATGYAEDEALAYAAKRPRGTTDAYAAVTPRDRMPAPFASRWNTWATGYGGDARVNGDSVTGSSTTTTRVYGVAAGADYRVSPDTRVGFALGGASANFNLDGGFGGGRADVFNAGVYGKHQWGAAYVASALAYTWQDTTTDRTVTVAGSDTLHASFRANALATRVETGWRTGTPIVAVTPYAAFQRTTFFMPGYGETATAGSGQFALSYASREVTAMRGELGARWDKEFLVRDGTFALRAKTAWAHDWNRDRASTAAFQSIAAPVFVVNGAQTAADTALLSVGADMKWRNGWSFAANFDGEFAQGTRSTTGKGTARYQW